ncbi:MAG: Eco57I restriction-modification methylase domain-containing protein [Clostridia bacterium]|nr:Eco57I restriction-modification methylase domain-containing protein [Clostridia bacterium]
MSTVVNKIESILTSEYSVVNYVDLMREIFDSMNLVDPNNFRPEFSNFSTHITGSVHIGNYTSPDKKKIAVFAVELKKENYVESSRSTQRSYAKKLIESGNCDAAIVAFYTVGETKWRLSFVRLDYEMKIEQGKLKTTENITPAKRYSFLVGKDEPCHTAIERFRQFIIDKNANPTLDELEEAFSVEKVTKEFFELYCEKFYQLQEFLDSNADFVEESQKCGFTSEQYAKKLMGQIVFLYFLQKKGWLGVNVWSPVLTEKEYNNVFFVSGAQGRIIKEHLPKIYFKQADGTYKLNSKALDDISDDDEEVIAKYLPRKKTWGDGSRKFLRTIFEFSKAHKGNFFENYLEPLFYNTLNHNRGAMGYCPALHCRIPFLSGGLFEPLDGYDWKSNNFDIPDEIFSNKKNPADRNADGILDIFDRYNFTISEDEPMEREVAVDPEMLGKIFENLLDVKDRKSKGAFYTPREIVHYMCQESLINYLVRKTEISEDALRDFILYGDFMKDEDTVKSKREGNGGMFISPEIFKVNENGEIAVSRLKDVDDALATVRVADPAVGSGAFPLGMMNEIVRARQNITSYMAIGMRAQDKFFLYKNDRSPYALKLNAIKNSIFAVDIEPSAVDIAQLRLWLSLVIDDEITPDATNELEGHKNPLPLPNLECNIICGNSLIDEFKGIKLVKESDILGTMTAGVQMDFGHAGFETVVKQLLKAQDELFGCDEPHKKFELKAKIQSLKDLIISEQLSGCSEETKLEYNFAVRRASKPFVLWQLDFARVFRDNGGFDIVIGNPPYIGESGHKEIFRAVAETKFGKRSYQGKMDFFYFFFHKGLDILHSKGDLAFITTNYFPTATGAKTLRKDFASRTYMRQLINFNEVRVFESALGQHNMITILTKDKEKDFLCRCTMCSESVTANAAKLNSILMGKDEKATHVFVAQDNLYDGSEYYIRQQGVTSQDTDSVGSILDKMAAQKQRLGKLAEVNQGVVSGCDTVATRNMEYIPASSGKIKNDGIYVFDLTNSRDVELVDSFTSGKVLLRDFYKNSDISRYSCSTTPTKKLLYYPDGLDEKKYPDILEHLENFRDLLEHRLVAYNEHYHWTALHRARKESIFVGEKIVVPYRTRTASFAFNDVEWFCRSDAYVITPKAKDVDLFFLLGILNSKLNFLWLYNRGKRKGEVLELFQVPLSEIPIIETTAENNEHISQLAREITEAKKAKKNSDTSVMEKEIDQILYKAYGLSDAEIALVEESVE